MSFIILIRGSGIGVEAAAIRQANRHPSRVQGTGYKRDPGHDNSRASGPVSGTITKGQEPEQDRVALVLPTSIFFHIPKAGGTFVRKTIRDVGIEGTEIGDPHISLEDFSKLHPQQLEGRFVFAFVRHPLGWWRSYWSHRDIRGWSAAHPMDQECQDTDFNRYMDQILRSRWRTHYLDIVRETITARTDFVGRQESLVSDLHRALTQAGEKYDPGNLGRLGFINQSDSIKAHYSAQQAADVLAIHEEMISRFYPRQPSLIQRVGGLLRPGRS